MYQASITSIVAAAAYMLTSLDASAFDDKARKPGVVELRVSRQTTFFTQPLDRAGSIDYGRAVNLHFSKGVTEQSNSLVMLLQVLGPRPERTLLSPQFFKWLKMNQPPDELKYHEDLIDWLTANELPNPDSVAADRVALLNRVMNAPWKRTQFPEAARWLEEQLVLLSLTSRAVRRDDYFSPLIGSHDANGISNGLVNALLPTVQKLRSLARGFVARAMLHLGEGRPIDAWRDLLSCHRLGRHVGKGSTLVERLVGFAIESMALQGDIAFLSTDRPSGKRADLFLRQFRALPPLPNLVSAIDVTERCLLLDLIIMVAREKAGALGQFNGNTKPIQSLLEQAKPGAIDWSLVLQDVNQRYDRYADAARVSNTRRRIAEFAKVDAEIKELSRRFLPIDSQAAKQPADSPRDSEEFNTNEKKLAAMFVAGYFGMYGPAGIVEARSRQMNANIELAFLLEKFRGDNGEYPSELKLLEPEYVEHLPLDSFTDEPLKYRRSDNGYILYSVGANVTDDEGRDDRDQPPGDDLTIRIPFSDVRETP